MKAICAFLLLGSLVASAQPNSSPSPSLWTVDGPVTATVETNGILFVAGSFSQIGPVTGGFAPLDPNTGGLEEPFAQVKGAVFASLPDGHGGVFIGGSFNRVGNQTSANVAHLNSDHQADTNFTFSTDGPVNALAYDGHQLFIGGSFTSINGQSRTNFAVLNVDTMQVAPLAVSVDGQILALALGANNLFVGGKFSTINGVNRSGLAAIDLSTSDVTTWNPAPDAIFGAGISVLVAADGRIYAAGDFTQIAGAARNRVAAFDATSGALLSWDANTSADYTSFGVYAMTVSSSAVYIGGNFTSLGGQPRSHIGAVDKTTGSALAWNPGISADDVNAICVSGNTVYVGGSFTGIGTSGPRRLAAVDATTGIPKAWVPAPSEKVLTITADNGVVYAGGEFNSIGGVQRDLLAAIDLSTGKATSWDAHLGGSSAFGFSADSLAIGGQSLYMGGTFYAIQGQLRNSIGAVNLTDGTVLPFNPNLGGLYRPTVLGLYPVGTNVIVTGAIPLGSPMVVSASTGQNANWNFGTDGTINSFAVVSNTIYIGGSFTHVAGQFRQRLAAFDAQTRQLLPWNPSVDNAVSKILVRDQTLIAIGAFLHANGEFRTNIAVFDRVSGDLSAGPTSLTVNGGIRTMATSQNSLYLGGDFTQVNGSNRNYFAAVDLISGRTREWDAGSFTGIPNYTLAGLTVQPTANAIIIGGTFSSIANEERAGIASFPITNLPPLVQILTPTNQTVLNAPAQVPLVVDASSPSGITRVDVFVRTNLLVSFTNAPYSTNWVVPKHVGDYLVTAVAYDGFGEPSLSSAARVTVVPPQDYVAPTLAITFPTSNATYAPFSTITVQTVVSSPKSAIETFEILLGTNVVATSANGPVTATFTNMAPGTYSVTARLVDEYGIGATNGPVTFKINNAPQVSLTNPRNGLVVGSGTNLQFTATATDSDGTIKSVDFYAGTLLIGQATNSPFSLVWSNVPAGSYALRAVATDDFGSVTTSSVVNVTIYQSPLYDVILDNLDTNVTFNGSWSTGTAFGRYGSDYRFANCASGAPDATASYRPFLPVDGRYDVFIWYPAGSNRSTNAPWSISYNGGTTNVSVNQTINGGNWYLLASGLNFLAGTNGFVTVSNVTGESTNSVVIADAVRFASSIGPWITNQPLSQVVKVGANVTFKVISVGSPPLSYQWRFNGTAIANATSSVLLLPQVQSTNAGSYSVVVSNFISAMTSSNAVLTVNPPRVPTLSTPTIFTNGQMKISLVGDAGTAYAIEGTTNLIDWTVLTNIFNTSGTLNFTNTFQTNGRSFYRARWTP